MCRISAKSISEAYMKHRDRNKRNKDTTETTPAATTGHNNDRASKPVSCLILLMNYKLVVSFLFVLMCMPYLFRNRENSSSDHDRKTEVKNCIESISRSRPKRPHGIFFEQVPRNVIVNCEEFGYKNEPNRTCMGWDDKDELVAFKNEFQMYVRSHLLKDLKQTRDSMKIDDLMLDKMLEMSLKQLLTKEAEINRDKKFKGLSATQYTPAEVKYLGNAWKIDETRSLMALRKSGKSYNEIFKLKDNLLNHNMESHHPKDVFHNKKFANKLMNRNKSLLETSEGRYGLLSIFVSGNGHLIDLGGEVGTAARYVQDELQKGKDQNPYAILAMMPKR